MPGTCILRAGKKPIPGEKASDGVRDRNGYSPPDLSGRPRSRDSDHSPILQAGPRPFFPFPPWARHIVPLLSPRAAASPDTKHLGPPPATSRSSPRLSTSEVPETSANFPPSSDHTSYVFPPFRPPLIRMALATDRGQSIDEGNSVQFGMISKPHHESKHIPGHTV
ncbi:hypothetical protein LY76DRAFT_580471 [Colletotrichum caudatum]|nr:hypothetical protein LY76DRAFT_580471 [Colletotrichum caudatum]